MKSGKVAAGEAGVGVDQRLDDLRVDLVADVAVALEGDHVLEAGALRNRDRRGEVVGVAVFVGDVLDEQHEQDVVLVLAGIHAAAQFIAGGPEGGVEVGFLDCHELDARLYEQASVAEKLGLNQNTTRASSEEVSPALATARDGGHPCSGQPSSFFFS